MRTKTFPILSADEFHKKLVSRLMDEWNNYNAEDIINLVLANGFTKYNIEDLGNFIKSNGIYFLGSFLVEFGSNKFLWFISGDKAILVNKVDKTTVQ
jgi:hypothetical protein